MTKRRRVVAATLAAVAAVLVVVIIVGVANIGGSNTNAALSPADIAKVNELLGLAQQQRINGQVAKAEESFNAIIEIDPTNHIALFNLGQLLRNRDDFDGAATLLKRSFAKRPDWEEARLEYALCLRDAGRVEDAISFLRESSSAYPAVLKYRLLLGMLLVRQGEFAEGDKLIGDVLRTDSSLEAWNP